MKKSKLFISAVAATAALFSAFAPALMNAGETTVWTGDGDFNSWKTVVEIPETAFANAKEGDVVRLTFTDCGATPQVQIAVKTVADWTWTEIVSYDDIVANKYEFTIKGTPTGCDDTLLAMLKAHGVYLKGQDAHLASIQLVSGDDSGSSSDTDTPSTPSTGSTDSVWTGDGDFNSWKTVVEIPETAFANLKEGDTVRLLFGDLGATPQVQIAVKTVADWTWTELVSYDDIVGGKYDLKVSGTPADCSDTMLAMLKAHGMYLKGQDAHVTGVEIVGAGGGSSSDTDTPSTPSTGSTDSVWTGDGDFNSWKTVVEIPETAFANLKEGDTVRLLFGDLGATPQVQIAVKTVADWTWTELVSYDDIVGGKYDLLVSGTPADCSDTMLAMLKAHGMYLKGQDAHVTGVEIVSAGGGSSDDPSTPSQGEEIDAWTGDTPFGEWKALIEIPASAFAKASAGDTLRFSFTDCGENPQLQIAIKVGDDWTWTELVSYDDIVGGKYDYKIPADTRADYSVIETLKERGMNMKGQNATPAKMTILTQGGTSAVEFIQTVNVNAPVEIYTLDGRRVNSMEKGIYILRQGNKTMKVIK